MTLLIRDDLKCRFAYDAQNFQDEEGHGLLSELQFLFFFQFSCRRTVQTLAAEIVLSPLQKTSCSG